MVIPIFLCLHPIGQFSLKFSLLFGLFYPSSPLSFRARNKTIENNLAGGRNNVVGTKDTHDELIFKRVSWTGRSASDGQFVRSENRRLVASNIHVKLVIGSSSLKSALGPSETCGPVSANLLLWFGGTSATTERRTNERTKRRRVGTAIRSPIHMHKCKTLIWIIFMSDSAAGPLLAPSLPLLFCHHQCWDCGVGQNYVTETNTIANAFMEGNFPRESNKFSMQALGIQCATWTNSRTGPECKQSEEEKLG